MTRNRLFIASILVGIPAWWAGVFGSEMVLLHGKGYCVWGVRVPLIERTIIPPPFLLIPVLVLMLVSCCGLFWALIKYAENPKRAEQ